MARAAARSIGDPGAARARSRRDVARHAAPCTPPRPIGFASRSKALGGTVAYASTSAPLVFARSAGGRRGERGRADPSVIEPRAGDHLGDADVERGSDRRRELDERRGDQGNGIRVAVVEYQNVRNTGDLSGQVVASHSTTGSLSYGSGGGDHPTWVAGAIASRNGTYAGVAPGADIVSASTGGYRPQPRHRSRDHRRGRLGRQRRLVATPTSSTPASARTRPPVRRRRGATSTPSSGRTAGWSSPHPATSRPSATGTSCRPAPATTC